MKKLLLGLMIVLGFSCVVSAGKCEKHYDSKEFKVLAAAHKPAGDGGLLAGSSNGSMFLIKDEGEYVTIHTRELVVKGMTVKLRRLIFKDCSVYAINYQRGWRDTKIIALPKEVVEVEVLPGVFLLSPKEEEK